MKFKLNGKHPIPVADGEVDNETILDAEHAAGLTDYSIKSLMALYEAVFPEGSDIDVEAAVEKILADWRNDPDKVLIRHSEFGEIKDADLAVFLVKCHQRKLNPWRGEAYPLFRFDMRTGNRIVLGVPIETLRAFAHATGQYAGLGAPAHEYGDSKIPIRTTITVSRWSGDRSVPFVGEAIFEEFFPNDGEGTLAATKPHICNATIAEAAALRRAFPRELSELYSPLEFPRNGPKDRGDDRLAPAEARALTDEETPHTYMGLHMALMDLGLDKPSERESAIAHFKSTDAKLLDRDERGFYAKVVVAVRDNPGKWRAAVG